MMAFAGIMVLFTMINFGRYVYTVATNEYYTPQTAYVVYSVCGFCLNIFSQLLMLVGLGLVRKLPSLSSVLLLLGVAVFLFVEIYYQVGGFVLEALVPSSSF